jgi:hypothetical protein
MSRKRIWRRVRHLSATAAGALILIAGIWIYGLRLRPAETLSGWLLAASIALLAAFGVRKKLRALPIGRASTWLRIHVDIGLVSLALFVVHGWYAPDAGFHLPNGVLEISLAAAYVATAATGLLGLALSRLLPPAITAAGDELILERLPIYRRELRERAEAVVLRASTETGATTLADFYLRALAGFFLRPQHFWLRIVPSRRVQLTQQLESLHRYLSDPEKDLSRELARLIEKKAEADHAGAMQGLLKVWLAVHVAVTGVLLVLALVHVVIVYRYGAA